MKKTRITLSSLLFFALANSLFACAAKPQIAVDPNSISDVDQYEIDMSECKAIALGYSNEDAIAKSSVLGAGAVVGTTAAILATGGLYLLPGGVALFGGGGAALGGGLSNKKQNEAREKIWAECMLSRGYAAYSG